MGQKGNPSSLSKYPNRWMNETRILARYSCPLRLVVAIKNTFSGKRLNPLPGPSLEPGHPWVHPWFEHPLHRQGLGQLL